MDDNFKNAKLMLYKYGEISGKTVGNSMWPLFRSGRDIATVKKLCGKPKLNDVLLYRKKTTDEFILHRLLKITEDGYIIRGDNKYYTEFVTDEDIIGVMTEFVRKGKRYDCENGLYKLYVVYIRVSYPFRRFMHKVETFLKIVKRKLIKCKSK